MACSVTNGQVFKTSLQGKIANENAEIEGIYILNKTANASTITDQKGFFEIDVKVNDTLVFSALQYEMKFVTITEDILKNKFLEVNLIEKVNELEPVTITPYDLSGSLAKDIHNNPSENVINGVSLGLPNATVKKKDHAHRMLYTASSAPLDLLINTLNGKIKKIKNLIKLQKEEAAIEEMKTLFEVEFYEKDLKIPEAYIDRFMYFCSVDPAFKTFSDENSLEILAFLQTKSTDFKILNELE